MNYKSLLTILLVFVASFSHQDAKATDPAKCTNIGSKEKLVCETIMCNPMGLLVNESRSKCLSTNRKFAVYLSTLGPFRKPAVCYKRGKQCQKIGIMTNAFINPDFCSGMLSGAEKELCESSIGNYNNPPSGEVNPGEIDPNDDTDLGRFCRMKPELCEDGIRDIP